MTDIELIDYLLNNEITDVKIEPDVIECNKRNNSIDLATYEGIDHNFFINLYNNTGREYQIYGYYNNCLRIEFKRETKDEKTSSS